MTPLYDATGVQDLNDTDLLDRYARLKDRYEASRGEACVDYSEVLDIVASEAIRRGLIATAPSASTGDIDEIPF